MLQNKISQYDAIAFATTIQSNYATIFMGAVQTSKLFKRISSKPSDDISIYATPSGEQKPQCLQEYEEVQELLQDNPGLSNGPELPICLPNGRFNPKQCSTGMNACWCADTNTGTVIPNTMTQGSQRDELRCDG